MIDTHAHLDFKQFDQDRSKVIDYALSTGVEKIVNIGVDLKSSESSIKLAEEHEQIYATVGFHPHDAKDLTEDSLKQITKLAQHEKVVAIGEIGLDFYRNLSPKEDQIRAFRKQIALAKELELPLVVHVREAWEQALTILRETEASKVGGVLHSFSGNSEQAKTAQDMGFYLGLNGTLTYPKSKIQSVAREISLDSIVVETDCPFLSPAPHRGKRNQPAYVRLVLDKLSGLLDPLTFQDLERITTLNACRLFGLDHASAGRIAYPIRDSLYLNITNQCSNACLFCVRNRTDFVKGHNLRLDHEPDYQEVIDSINHVENYREVVFCGYGEPTIRLDLLKEVARYLKNKNVEVRLNTNGQGNLIHKRNIVSELVDLIDTVSISLNVDDEEKYERLCQPRFGDNAFGQVVAFARECKKLLPRTVLTVLDMPEVDLKKCETISKELGVELRIRHYNKVG
ncbi:MAG: TatD family hydrolase [Candidatus Zixiibacteriota bacterium]